MIKRGQIKKKQQRRGWGKEEVQNREGKGHRIEGGQNRWSVVKERG